MTTPQGSPSATALSKARGRAPSLPSSYTTTRDTTSTHSGLWRSNDVPPMFWDGFCSDAEASLTVAAARRNMPALRALAERPIADTLLAPLDLRGPAVQRDKDFAATENLKLVIKQAEGKTHAAEQYRQLAYVHSFFSADDLRDRCWSVAAFLRKYFDLIDSDIHPPALALGIEAGTAEGAALGAQRESPVGHQPEALKGA